MPTDSLLSVFAFSFLLSIGAVVSPGPVSAAIVTESPRQGWRVGPLIAASHVSLELLIVLLLGAGLAAGMGSPSVRRLIAVAGGVVLLLIGATYLHGALTGRMRLPDPDREQPRRSTINLLSLGVLTTISNPFWYAWWLTVAAGYLVQASPLGAAGPAAFFAGHMTADFAWNSFLSTMTSYGGRWLTDRRYRALILLTAGFMAYLGLVFLRTGLAV